MCVTMRVCVSSEHADCVHAWMSFCSCLLFQHTVPNLHTSPLHLSMIACNLLECLTCSQKPPPLRPPSKRDSLCSSSACKARLVSKLAPPPWPHLLETALLTCCPIVSSGDGWGAASAGAILHSIAAPSVDCVTLGYKRGFYSVCAGCERSYLRGLPE